MPPPNEAYMVVATQKFNAHISYLFNDTKSHVLCVNQAKATMQNPFPSLSFCVYDLSENNIVYEESIYKGRVRRLNADQIEISSTPGMITKAYKKEDSMYVYDLKTGEKKRMAPNKIK